MTQTSAATAQSPGAEAFQKKCGTCHGPNAAPTIKGPELKGVYNRPIASLKGYAYSDALKAKSSFKWTEANLNSFLAKPRDWAPSTKMAVGVSDATQRAQIVQHLKTYK
jgi:cytochrome c